MIEIEKTFNENVINFYCDVPLLKAGESDYADANILPSTSLLNDIFTTGLVKRALLLSDMLFVEKKDEASSHHLETLLPALLTDAKLQDVSSDAHLLPKVEALIEARIRPFLHTHGGDIAVILLKDDVLTLRFEGHCKGCMQAEQTLNNIIKTTLTKYLPQIKAIEREE